jgi:hypothetical protein
MADVICPECGVVTELETIERSAKEFCSHCDFPLFWAPTARALSSAELDGGTLRRLPGAGGRMRVGSRVCPACGELNPLGNVYCLRCRSELDPKPPEPPPPPAPEPPPPPPPAPPPPPPEPRLAWWWLLVAAGALALVVLLVLWLAL